MAIEGFKFEVNSAAIVINLTNCLGLLRVSRLPSPTPILLPPPNCYRLLPLRPHPVFTKSSADQVSWWRFWFSLPPVFWRFQNQSASNNLQLRKGKLSSSAKPGLLKWWWLMTKAGMRTGRNSHSLSRNRSYICCVVPCMPYMNITVCNFMPLICVQCKEYIHTYTYIIDYNRIFLY